MIVIYRNGVRTEISGWRAWLLLLAVSLATVLLVCLLLGIALTFATLFLFALPILFVLALAAQVFQPRR
jgi:ABC-type multidrug transport system permease subunit